MKSKILLIGIALAGMMSCNSNTDNTATTNTVQPAPVADSTQAASGVFFVNLKDGDTVTSPVIVDMGVSGMQVEPAGEIHEGKGHHHLIIDAQFIDKGTVVPTDEKHIHYGKGQTADTIDLAPGAHTLTLQFADGHHQSYGPDWSKTIAITVKQ